MSEIYDLPQWKKLDKNGKKIVPEVKKPLVPARNTFKGNATLAGTVGDFLNKEGIQDLPTHELVLTMFKRTDGENELYDLDVGDSGSKTLSEDSEIFIVPSGKDKDLN